MTAAATENGRIRVGIGGWSYEPWRETFYPHEVAKTKELEYASRQLTAIEINSTFYRLQKPAVFAKWRDATPDSFVFTLEAPRYVTNRKVLAEAGEAAARFIDSGIVELGNKLGPLLWQLAPTKHFDVSDIEQFLKLLPTQHQGLALRHVLEVRHQSFMTSEFLTLARAHRVATVFADSPKYPSFADVTGDFVYARLMRSVASEQTGYSAAALAKWAECARAWRAGDIPADLPRVEPRVDYSAAANAPRDVFIFMINGAKERAPAAAMQLLSLLKN